MTIDATLPAAQAVDGPRPTPEAQAVDRPASGPEELVTVRVWDLPVRLMHWTLVASIVVLTVTGAYIADPFIIAGPGPATGFTMGTVRAVHITTGWIFTVVLLARIAWSFRGNIWARWHQFIPVARHRRKMIRPTLAYYLFFRRQPPPAVGHNPLAGMTYLVLFLMFGFQAFTGFALQALNNPNGTMAFFTKWLFRFATIPEVRLWHYIIMWMTWGFAIHHVYSAWLIDREERCGELSSMFTGWKTLPADRLRNAPELKKKKKKKKRSSDASPTSPDPGTRENA